MSVTNNPETSPMATPINPRIRLSEKNIQKTCRVEAPCERNMPISCVRSPMFMYMVFKTITMATQSAITDMICKPLCKPDGCSAYNVEQAFFYWVNDVVAA